MTTCTTSSATPTSTPTSLGDYMLDVLQRFFSHSVASPAEIDRTWSASGLEGLDRATLVDIGAAPELIARAELREAWKLGWSLEAMRRM